MIERRLYAAIADVAGGMMMGEEIILTTFLLGWLFYSLARQDEEREALVAFAGSRSAKTARPGPPAPARAAPGHDKEAEATPPEHDRLSIPLGGARRTRWSARRAGPTTGHCGWPGSGRPCRTTDRRCWRRRARHLPTA